MDGSLYYVHQDHLGSTVAVSDEDGYAVGRVQYDPYGEVLASTLPVTLTSRLFTGARFDGTTGLYQMGARWYDPALGRWIQPDTLVPDPLNPQAWNRFSYVDNNPASYVDPGGHIPIWDILDVGSFLWSSYELYRDPSWANLGWWALDVVSLLPLIPSLGLLSHGDEAVDVLRAAGRMEDVGDARVGLIVIERVEGSTDIYQSMGHVAAFVEIGEERWVRGFWPIPPEGMAVEEFRVLLWERTFPGQILNDVRMFDYTEAIVRSWDVPESVARHMLGQIERVGPTALQYGLRPGKLGGENCVTWAARLVEEAGIRTGSDVDAATSADQLPLEAPQVTDESRMMRLKGRAIIDRVELAYYAPPGALGERPGTEMQPEFSLVQPVWVFHGHSEDGRATFRAYVQAVADDYLQ